ncbi:Bgt-20530 [Blumeria graminis f. sp. tritici]|uniref:Bgt-20530 n=1 Tax=Blumeria graminis f. sp. tritici TaxID=62690 RepID=A0A9X9MH26_BLUGR|nr:Bgt-20530 [Blumeria graminis f. sp. tritici]
MLMFALNFDSEAVHFGYPRYAEHRKRSQRHTYVCVCLLNYWSIRLFSTLGSSLARATPGTVLLASHIS